METDSWRIWKTTQVSGSYVTEEYHDHNKVGNVNIQPSTIHWQVGNILLRDADNEDTIMYHISWRWSQPISTGAVCTNPVASN